MSIIKEEVENIKGAISISYLVSDEFMKEIDSISRQALTRVREATIKECEEAVKSRMETDHIARNWNYQECICDDPDDKHETCSSHVVESISNLRKCQ